jgi:MYND finger
LLHAKLDPDYDEMNADDDILVVVGLCFGVQKSDLNFDPDTAVAKNAHSEMSCSEVILRFGISCTTVSASAKPPALLQGPDCVGGVKALFLNGLAIVNKMPNFWPSHIKIEAIDDLIRRASSLDLDTIKYAPVPTQQESNGEVLMECDYCGDEPPKKLECSGCYLAIYCNRACQEGDWKRHKPLCSRYQKQSMKPKATTQCGCGNMYGAILFMGMYEFDDSFSSLFGLLLSLGEMMCFLARFWHLVVVECETCGWQQSLPCAALGKILLSSFTSQ